ncbi:MAG: phage portal protein [Eubacteriales bacterium]|nr:phage portal protein [Eubacteriales bacterium]
MRLFRFFQRAEQTESGTDVAADLLKALITKKTITKEEAMNVPAFAACVDLIANTVSMIPFYLYRRGDDEVQRVDDDRVTMLNDDTGDTLTGVQFKRAIVTDYLTGKGGYAYINKPGTKHRSLHYVREEEISFRHNVDPVFKSYSILVQGRLYQDFEFLKVLRNSRNGWSGVSIVEENRELLSAAYYTQQLQKVLAQTGGNKKGFVRSPRHLTEESMDALKTAWSNLYQSKSENVVILNDGLEFKESSSTSAELQLNESVQTMTDSICKVLGIPAGMLSEHPTAEDQARFIQYCIIPILTEIECSLNRDLLKENEKKTLFFAADTSDLTKGNIKERYDAYAIGIKSGFLQIDEVRFMEHKKPLGLDYVKLGLQDVLYDPQTKLFYNPNMNQSGSFDSSGTVIAPDQTTIDNKNPPSDEDTGGGEPDDENRDTEGQGDD